mgnify:CR=1 FL=1
MSAYHHDPKTYRECSEPHESVEAAEDAMRAFIDGVRELRKTHRVQDVSLVLAANALDDGGREIALIGDAHIGDQSHAETMLARGLGRAERERLARISEQRKGGAR